MANPTSPAPAPTRERLLDAAAELFHQKGIGVSTEELCRAAGVSKRSMYQLFSSKDEVMAANLERSAPRYEAFLLPGDDVRPPRARILHVFEKTSADPQLRGCPLVSIVTELKSPQHPASLVARQFKSSLTAFFEKEARRGQASDPILLARHLTVAFDGAGAWAVMRGEGTDGLAVEMATTILGGTAGLP